jgi:hypothetical protein
VKVETVPDRPRPSLRYFPNADGPAHARCYIGRQMATTRTGTVHGTTIELESSVPELDGKRVRVVLEAVDEPRLTSEQHHEL